MIYFGHVKQLVLASVSCNGHGIIMATLDSLGQDDYNEVKHNIFAQVMKLTPALA